MENNELIKHLQKKVMEANIKIQALKIMNEKLKEEQTTNRLAMFFVALIFGGTIYLFLK